MTPPTEPVPPAVAASPDALRRLADAVDAHARAGRPAEAEAVCRAALVARPGDGAVLQMLGVVLMRAGRTAEAIESLRRAAVARPTAAAHTSLGMALATAGDADGAIAALSRAADLQPGCAEADVQLGGLLLDRGRPAEAAAAYRRAVLARPDWTVALLGLGNALYAHRQLGPATEAYQRALALDPGSANALLNLGNVLAASGRFRDAIVAFRRSVVAYPDDPLAHNNLATALYTTGQLDDAEASFHRALALRPAYPEALCNLGGVMKDKGRLDEAISLFRRTLAVAPGFLTADSNLVYTLSFHPADDPAALLAEARRWDAHHTRAATASARPHDNDRSPGRRLRVGYVSPDLRRHAVGQFLLPLVEHHDRGQVDVFLYSLGTRTDELSAMLQQLGTWRELAGLSDDQAAELIRADDIDVLVDLTLHMGNNRLPIFARRPAPVQVTYLAYAGTSGMAAMDYRLSDPYLDPSSDVEANYSERTVRLPQTYWCYQQPYDVAPVADPPAAARGFITFASLNNFCKVNAGVLSAWAEVLGRAPGSRLLLHANEGDHRDATLRLLAARGVAADRVTFNGMVHTERYLALYNQADVALDTFPYNGGTTTCDAVWMGVPVVSLAGRQAVGRAGRSILTQVGHPELVADDVDGYVRTAVDLAGDLPRLTALRRSLRDRMRASPLMDGPAFARGVEAAYRQMWRAWCGG